MSKQISYSAKKTQGEKATMKMRNLILVLSTLTLPLQAADVGTAYLNLPIAATNAKTKLIGVFLARKVEMKGELSGAVTNGATSFLAYSPSNNIFSSYTAATENAGTGPGSELAPLSDNHYLVEFTSGPYSGLTAQVSSFGTNQVNVKGNLPSLADRTTFTLRKDHTLSSLLDSAGLLVGGNSTAADTVSVLSSTGQLNRYIKTNDGWRSDAARAVTDPDCGNVRVSLGTGFWFKAKGTKTINLQGEYRGARSMTYVGTTGCVLANPYPVDMKLGASGIGDHMQTLGYNDDGTGADTIKFLDGGRYTDYYYDGINYRKSFGYAVSDDRVLGVGEAFLFKPAVGERIAFNPQYITK